MCVHAPISYSVSYGTQTHEGTEANGPVQREEAAKGVNHYFQGAALREKKPYANLGVEEISQENISFTSNTER